MHDGGTVNRREASWRPGTARSRLEFVIVSLIFVDETYSVIISVVQG